MDFKNLSAHFATTSWEPTGADNAWKRLFGERPFDLDNLPFKERLETAKAWRLETIRVASEHARTGQQRDAASTHRKSLIETLSQKTKFQQLSQGEQTMQDTIQNYQTSNSYDAKNPENSDRSEQERAEQERNEHRLEQAHADAQRADQERADQQQQQHLDQQRNDQEGADQQRLDQQRVDQERLDQQRVDQQRVDLERTEQQRLDQQQKDQERADQERAEQATINEKEAQLRSSQYRENEERELQLKERDQLEYEERTKEIEAERELANERNLEDDERAYKAAEDKFKELQELERQRQSQGRLGGNSADSLLSKFFQLVEKVKQERDEQQQREQEHERQEEGQRLEQQQYERQPAEQQSQLQHLNEHEQQQRDELQGEHHEQIPHDEQHSPERYLYEQPDLSHSSVADFHIQSVEDLLNSFDKPLDVHKDLNLDIEGPMLIDELDRGFDIDKDVESNWNFENWAEKEFSLDDIDIETVNLPDAYSTSSNINNLLFENDTPPQSLEWEKSPTELQITNWERNAYDPELLREQNDRSLASVREGGDPELEYQSDAHLPLSEHSGIDQIMQQQVQQAMQTQIHQTFTGGAERSPFEPTQARSNKEDREQQLDRDDDGSARTR